MNKQDANPGASPESLNENEPTLKENNVDPNVLENKLLDNATERIAQRIEKHELLQQMIVKNNPDIAPEIVKQNVDDAERRRIEINSKLEQIDQAMEEIRRLV